MSKPKKSASIADKASRFEALMSLFKMLWEAFQALPFSGWLVAVVFAAGAAVLGFIGSLEYWQIALLFSVTFLCIAIGIERIVTARQKIKARPVSYKELGDRLVTEGEIMQAYCYQLIDSHDITEGLPLDEQKRLLAFNQRQIDMRAVTIKFNRKHHASIAHLSSLLSEAGVAIPFHIGSNHGIGPMTICHFFVHVGKLLQDEKIELARQIDNEFGFRFMDQFF